MALGDSYSTLALLRARVGITDASFTTEDAKLTTALEVASREIEKACHRQFNTATSATARKYYPDKTWMTEIDDFSAITSIKADYNNDGTYETTWASTDYQLEPLNGVVDGESGWPYYRIRAVGSYRFPCVSETDRAPLEVTATWGWSAVPAPIKEGCLILAEELYKLKDSPFGVGGYGQLGIIRARENPMVWARIGRYVRDLVLVG
jgi:hypothetical protein